jgi:glucosamine--fructose-6-phosphate aminotransferase (isomerizing)
VALAAPSLFSVYRQPPCLRGALVVGISQSGQSPDIVAVLSEAGRQGALTLAITNDPASPLARASEFVLDLCAGPERAVAATKTYTAELMAIAMVSAALNEDRAAVEILRAVPGLVEEALRSEEAVARAAGRLSAMDQCVVLGRGYNFATAHEWSLKLKELAYVVAAPYSSADFLHGPIAMVEPGFPVLAVAPAGAAQRDMVALLLRLHHEHRADLLVISNDQEVLAGSQALLWLPMDLPEWISPMVSIVPAQLFCYHVTCAKGHDPEKPRGLSKVTLTH